MEICELEHTIIEKSNPPQRRYLRGNKTEKTCNWCYEYIDSDRYICSVIPKYGVRMYYHKVCFAKYLGRCGLRLEDL